jgi:ubiquinone/menaquinone biosynthesis C-methylase UbiE
LLYADPRNYWTLRGGVDYFGEQEGQPARGERAEWIARRIASYQPASVLEVGCGYGKLLAALRDLVDVPLAGIDFSSSQLTMAREYLGDRQGISLFLASGEDLPFADCSFDLVVTSAVILHNPPRIAESIRREIVRVGKRYAVHNEETNHSYNRFGYDTALWYRQHGFSLAECGPIPADTDPAVSQFCVACLSRDKAAATSA